MAVDDCGLTPDARRVVTRTVLWPSWVALGVVAAAFLAGVTVPLRWQFVPLAVSVLALGLPHGAVDHLVFRRAGGYSLDQSLTLVGGVYLVLGGGYALLWSVAPSAAFALFIALTWLHWGQGDLYPLVDIVGADHLRTRGARLLAVVVRGGLPMVVPLVAFPGQYRRVADLLVGLFAADGETGLAWAFTSTVQAGLGVVLGVAVAASLLSGYRASGGSRAWRVDAGETLLLSGYFAVVPPILAIGLYFPLWHSARHIARLVALDDDGASALREGRVGRAAAGFARDSMPLSVGALAIFGGLYAVVPHSPGDLPELVGLYLVLLAVLTLPHTVVVTWLDRVQGLYT